MLNLLMADGAKAAVLVVHLSCASMNKIMMMIGAVLLEDIIIVLACERSFYKQFSTEALSWKKVCYLRMILS